MSRREPRIELGRVAHHDLTTTEGAFVEMRDRAERAEAEVARLRESLVASERDIDYLQAQNARRRSRQGGDVSDPQIPDEAVEAAADVLRPMLDDAVRPRPTSYEAARAALTAAYPHLFIDALVQYAPTFKDYLRRRYG